MEILGIVLLVILLAGIGIVLWGIGVYNSLIKMRNNIDEAYSTMDVYLKKRYDLIPNLVETVKGYTKHESQTLEKVIAARNMAMNAGTTQEKMKGENELSKELKTLLNVVVEQYPDLKANQNFIDLQASLKQIEAEIANSRKYYNGTVKVYNVKREVFPSSIVANMKKFEKRELFEVDDKEERKAVKVSF
ncbi:MAG: LemA family protein [Christensenellales bacterium]|jgi:LemA protein